MLTPDNHRELLASHMEALLLLRLKQPHSSPYLLSATFGITY